jgi:hypothetical protein
MSLREMRATPSNHRFGVVSPRRIVVYRKGHQWERRRRCLPGMKSFLLSRLRGDAPLHTVFWRDMLVIGTGLNILAIAAALILVAAEAPGLWQLVAYLSPQPWNLFAFFAVWQSAGHIDDPVRSLVRMAAAAWLAIMVII